MNQNQFLDNIITEFNSGIMTQHFGNRDCSVNYCSKTETAIVINNGVEVLRQRLTSFEEYEKLMCNFTKAHTA